MKQIINKLTEIDKKAKQLKLDNEENLNRIKKLYEEEINEYRDKSLSDAQKDINQMKANSDIKIKEMKDHISALWAKKISVLKTKYKESEEDIVDEMVNTIISYGNNR